MAEFKKGDGHGSMFVGDGSCNPQSPNMENMATSAKTPHDMLHKNNKVVGGDLRGGSYKGKTVEGRVNSIPNHYQTQNGNTKELPDKRAKVTGR